MKEKKTNYLDFDTLFVVAFFFCFFVYPVFVYVDNAEYSLFIFRIDDGKINSATALALVGICAYYYGSFIANRFKSIPCNGRGTPVDVKTLGVLFVSCFILYFIAGGFSQFAAEYSGADVNNDGMVGYILIILTALGCAYGVLYVFQYNFDSIRKLLIPFGLLIVVGGSFFLSGCRTYGLLLILSFIAAICLKYKPLSISKTTIGCVVGVIMMAAVRLMRQGDDALAFDYWYDPMLDLIVNNRSTMVSMSYVDRFGYSYGISLLSYILASIPFLQTLVVWMFNIDPGMMRSELIFTRDGLQGGTGLGLGTNIIGDAYLAFGVVGVVVIMALLGYCMKKHLIYASKGYKFSMLFYAIYTGSAVYLVRSSVFFPIRFFILGLFLSILFSSRPKTSGNTIMHK